MKKKPVQLPHIPLDAVQFSESTYQLENKLQEHLASHPRLDGMIKIADLNTEGKII